MEVKINSMIDEQIEMLKLQKTIGETMRVQNSTIDKQGSAINTLLGIVQSHTRSIVMLTEMDKQYLTDDDRSRPRKHAEVGGQAAQGTAGGAIRVDGDGSGQPAGYLEG